MPELVHPGLALDPAAMSAREAMEPVGLRRIAVLGGIYSNHRALAAATRVERGPWHEGDPLRDGLVEELRVHLEADGGHVSRLLVTEQVAGAADLEVAHGDLEARAQLGVV